MEITEQNSKKIIIVSRPDYRPVWFCLIIMVAAVAEIIHVDLSHSGTVYGGVFIAVAGLLGAAHGLKKRILTIDKPSNKLSLRVVALIPRKKSCDLNEIRALNNHIVLTRGMTYNGQLVFSLATSKNIKFRYWFEYGSENKSEQQDIAVKIAEFIDVPLISSNYP